MKLYAFLREETHDRLIHVWEAERFRREHPEEAARRRYVSTQLDAEQRTEMVLVQRDGQLFFRYKQLPEGGEPSGGQTLTHLRAKEILAGLERPRFRLSDGVLTLSMTEWQPEKRLDMPEGPVIVDLAGTFSSASPARKVRGWKGRVLLEIAVTHPVGPQKRRWLEEEGFPVLEIAVPPELRLPESLETTEQELLAAEERLRQMLEGEIPARLITDPRGARRPSLRARVARYWEEAITN